MARKRKLIFEFDNGKFYKWRGESSRYAVVHETGSPADAADFSHLLYPEQEKPFGEGKFAWYEMSLTRMVDYVKGDTEKWGS